jgi:hypothetical protein
MCDRYGWDNMAHVSTLVDQHSLNRIREGNFDAITSGMGGIHGIGTGIIGLNLTQILDTRITYGDLPTATRRLQQLIIIIMEATDWVIWDAVYTSLLDPTNHQLCAGNTATVRARILYPCINNDHPTYVVRVISSEAHVPMPDRYW